MLSTTDSISQAPPDEFEADMAAMSKAARWIWGYALWSDNQPASAPVLPIYYATPGQIDINSLQLDIGMNDFACLADQIGQIGRPA